MSNYELAGESPIRRELLLHSNHARYRDLLFEQMKLDPHFRDFASEMIMFRFEDSQKILEDEVFRNIWTQGLLTVSLAGMTYGSAVMAPSLLLSDDTSRTGAMLLIVSMLSGIGVWKYIRHTIQSIRNWHHLQKINYRLQPSY